MIYGQDYQIVLVLAEAGEEELHRAYNQLDELYQKSHCPFKEGVSSPIEGLTQIKKLMMKLESDRLLKYPPKIETFTI